MVKDGPFVLRKLTLFKEIEEDELMDAKGAQRTPCGHGVDPSSSNVKPSRFIFEETEIFKRV